MKTLISYIIITLSISYSVYSQDFEVSDTNVMEPLQFMLGKWEGNAWSMTRDGKVESNISEHIYCKTNCNIMVAEGLGTKINPETNETVIVHDAFGIMYLDPDTKKLTLRAYKDNKISISEIELIEDKVIRWEMTIPNQGTARFTSDYSTENTWIEVGEFSRDGETWIQFLGMELIRIDN
ncbi:hypothetical protein [Xanthomarina sp. GH4-25]|uniref:hypothetical protein n=1 Tax=Xanthomarina sp. GH4-25 TaxID=3349335 RepID=UPI000D67CEDF|nr:hypothetical protein DI383_01780 [Flavobacteriaceae bacterium LYZ1037]